MLNYTVKKLLPVLSTEMISAGVFDELLYGALSAAYMIAYASGQLLCGFLGDRIRARAMLLFGFTVTGGGLFLFYFTKNPVLYIVAFAVAGFGLSAMRGPLVKALSENATEGWSRLGCTLLSTSSTIGPLIVGLLSVFFRWDGVFLFTAIACIVMGVAVYFGFTVLEKIGYLKPVTPVGGKNPFRSLGTLFRAPDFLRFFFIGIIVEILASSLGDWMPLLLSEVIGLGDELGTGVYLALSAVRPFISFAVLFVFRFFRRETSLVAVSHTVSGTLFLLTFLLPSEWIAVRTATLVLATVTASFASYVLWSIYLPSLGRSGVSSSGNGILDCAGYAGAAIATFLFSVLFTSVGGANILLVCAILCAIGITLALVGRKPLPKE
jgi:MFS family permease